MADDAAAVYEVTYPVGLGWHGELAGNRLVVRGGHRLWIADDRLGGRVPPVPWPDRGAVVWQHPQEWSGSLTGCTRGEAYPVKLRSVSPSAEVVARVMDAWTRTRTAAVFRCVNA